MNKEPKPVPIALRWQVLFATRLMRAGQKSTDAKVLRPRVTTKAAPRTSSGQNPPGDETQDHH